LILAVALALYFPSLFYYFVGDDSGALIRLADKASALKAFEFRWPMAPHGGYFRPLQWLPFMLGYSAGGLPLPPDPRWQAGSFLFGYHLLSLLFHLGNIILVYIISRFIFKSRSFAALAAMIFAAHPAIPEAVCWISVFGDLSLVFFSLLAVILFAKFYMHAKDTFAYLFYFATLACFILALCSKEPAVMLPVLFILTAVYLHKKKEDSRANWDRLVYILSFFAVIPAYLIIRGLILPDFQAPLLDPLGNMGVIFSKLAYYFRDLALPVDYSWLRYFVYRHAALSVAVLMAVVCLGALFLIFLKKYHKVPEVMAPMAWVALTLILPLLAPYTAMRRHLYLVLVGFSILLAGVVFVAKRKFILLLFVLIFIVCEIWTTGARCQLFKLSGLEVRDGLVELQRDLPRVEPGSVICLAGIPGVLKNTPSFYADPVDKIKLLYRHADVDIFCASVLTFTEKSIKESNFEFIDDYNFIQSLESNLDEYIRVPAGAANVRDAGWQMNAEGKLEFKVLGRNKYGEIDVVAFRMFPETIKGRTVYIIGYKDGRVGLIRRYRADQG